MQEKTRAVVLHITRYSEASLIVKAYTETHGLQSFLVNSVRKEKARHAYNLFQPLSLIEIVAYFKKQGGLHRLSEASPSPSFQSIPYDTIKTTVAIFLAEILFKSIREEETNPALFSFVDHGIRILDLNENTDPNFHLSFLIQLTRYLGFYPSGDNYGYLQFFDLREGVFLESIPEHPYYLDKNSSALFSKLLPFTFETLSGLQLNAPERKRLLDILVMYYELHQTQGTGIRSHLVLKDIFD